MFSTSANATYSPYGYCGVVILDLGTKLVVFVQNADGTGEDPASFQLISKDGVLGYARPPIAD